MTGPTAHSVVAGALADPELLRKWRAGAAAAPPKLDVETLWKFAGLAAKVKHNLLRTDLPLVWQTLSVFEVDVEFFAEYAPHAHALKEQGKTSRADKLTSFEHFLDEWLCRHAERLGPSYRVAADVLRHEATLCDLRYRPADDLSNCRPWPRTPSTDDIPVFCGDVRLLRLMYNPSDVQAALAQGKAAIDSLTTSPVDQCRVYWKSGDARVRILQVQESSFDVIRCVNGNESIDAIALVVGQGDAGAKAVVQETLAELGEVGIVALVPGCHREDRLH